MGVALKVLDGNIRASSVATVALLKKLELFEGDENSRLSCYDSVELFNHNKILVGKIEAIIED